MARRSRSARRAQALPRGQLLDHRAPVGAQALLRAVPFGVGVAAEFHLGDAFGWRVAAFVRCIGRWRWPHAGLLQRDGVVGRRLDLAEVPQVAVVVAPGRGHGVVLRLEAHAHLAQVVGEDRGDGAEGVVVFQPRARDGLVEQAARLVHPVVVILRFGKQQHAVHARDQRGKAQVERIGRGRQRGDEPAVQAGKVAAQQPLDARIFKGRDHRDAHRLERARRSRRRRVAQVRDRMRHHRAVQAHGFVTLGQQQPTAREHHACTGQRLHVDIDAGQPARQQREGAEPVVHPNCASTKPCSALAMSGSSVRARVIVMSQLSRGDTPSRISTPA
ncbi:hypothetical protein D3C86_889850 [compost metagenome]